MLKAFPKALLFSTSALFAAENPCCPPCEPACSCKPKTCIDCVCYTPKFYDLECDWGFILDLEFLYFYSKEKYLPYAIKGETKLAYFTEDMAPYTYLLPTKEMMQSSKWDPGVRVGIGWNTPCDGWDFLLSWTYMSNKKSSSTKVNEVFENDIAAQVNRTKLLTSPWDYLFINTDITGVIGAPVYSTISSRWRLSYNVIDFEMGRKYWLSQCFNLRPFAALRGSWIQTRFRVENGTDFLTGINYTDEVFYRNRIWGVGLLAGLMPTWHFTPCLALYASLDAALLWGREDAKRTETLNLIDGIPTDFTTFENPLSYTTDSRIDGMQPVLDLALGLRYENTFCCDRYRFTFDLGWEHHEWLNLIHKFVPAGQTTGDKDDESAFARYYTGINDIENNLSLGGLAARVRFDF